MPRKSPRCPKCHSRSRQTVFLKANPNISDENVLRGQALFECKHCKRIFLDSGGMKRVGASKTYWKYKKESAEGLREVLGDGKTKVQ